MKKYAIALTCTFTAALALFAAAPTAACAAEVTATVQTVEKNADSQTAAGWKKDEKGRFFYLNEKGENLTGEQKIDGESYLFAKNGVLKTGWRTVDGVRRYYDPQTGKPVYGWTEYCGGEYYLSQKDGKATGILEADDGCLYFMGDKGSKETSEGFIKYKNDMYFAGKEGKLATGKCTINNRTYIFDSNGREHIGWTDIDGKIFYFSPDTGVSYDGFIEVEGKTYYIDPVEGRKSGKIEINGSLYYFGDDCSMQTGIIAFEDGKYFYGEDGKRQTGIISYNGNSYFFDEESGKMMTGRRKINDKKYFFNEDGTMAVGWKELDGAKYYFMDDGVMASGIINIDGYYFYFDEETGKLTTGRRIVNGQKYYFTPEGPMHTGWIDLDNSHYFFGEDGIMYVGWHEIDGCLLYFDSKGILLTGGWKDIDGAKYYLETNGAAVIGWKDIDGSRYYFNKNGSMATGWADIDGKKYHFASNGVMDKDIIIDDFNLTSDGSAVPLSDLQKRAKKIINDNGKTPKAIYDYVCDNNTYTYIEATRSYKEIETKGWSYFAEYAMDHEFVVGYYFAAISDLLFQQAGYKTRIVYGTGRGTTDHYWNQVLIDGVWVNYDACNGYFGKTDAFLKEKNYTFKQYINAKYY